MELLRRLSRSRLALLGCWLAACGVSLVSFFLITPRLILVNDGFLIYVPRVAIIVSFLAVAMLLAFAIWASSVAMRLLFSIAGLCGAILALAMLLERTTVNGRGVEVRSGWKRKAILWSQVDHVTVEADAILLVGGVQDGGPRIDVSRLSAAHSAAVQRTIARRISQLRVNDRPKELRPIARPNPPSSDK